MKHIEKYNNFDKTFESLSMDSFKNLINKVKSIFPKSKIDEFIKNNKEEVERVKDLITNDDNEFDYNKALNLVKKGVNN